MAARAQRRRKRAGALVPHLTWRGNVAYWARRHAMLDGGRVVRSLEVKRDKAELAITYATSLNTLCDRGDWNVVRRWADGDVHISEIARAVREGDYSRLNRLNIAGTLLGVACDDFMKRTRATLKGKHTAITHESVLKQLRDAWGDDFPMASATVAQCEAFLHEPKENADGEPWMPKTQAGARTIYRQLWNFIIDREAEDAEKQGAQPSVTKNPWAKVKIPKRRRTRHSFLLWSDWDKLIRRHAETPVAAVLCLGIMGLRRAEIQHIRTRVDIHLDDDPKVIVQDREGAHAWRTKTENSVRTLQIPPSLRPHLRHHAEHFAGEHFFIESERHAGNPIGDTTIAQWVENALTAVGLKYGRQEWDALTLHSLRHTCATWMLSDNVPLPSVAEWLGDTQAVVLDVYGHHIPSDRDRAIKALETALVTTPLEKTARQTK